MNPVKPVKLLPNIITAANLFCGFLAMIYVARALGVSSHEAEHAAKVTELLALACKYIIIAMVFDALDGKVARMVKGTSDFGAQLDSLCDAVSFCVAPAFLMYGTCRLMPVFSEWYPAAEGLEGYGAYFPEEYLFILAVIYVICGVMRLARFNVETTDSEEDHQYFKGLPTPAAAAVMVSAVMLLFNAKLTTSEYQLILSPIILYCLPIFSLVLAILMVTSVPYVHVVSLFGRTKTSFEVLVVVLVVATLAYLDFYMVMFFAMQIYLLTGVLGVKKKFQKNKNDEEKLVNE